MMGNKQLNASVYEIFVGILQKSRWYIIWVFWWFFLTFIWAFKWEFKSMFEYLFQYKYQFSDKKKMCKTNGSFKIL